METIDTMSDAMAILSYMNAGYAQDHPLRIKPSDVAKLSKDDRAELGPLARAALATPVAEK